MRFLTITDQDERLAASYGRFIHACANLERNLEFVLSRLTPSTDAMATAMFAKNGNARNIDIIISLISLPDVPLSNDQRENIRSLMTAVKSELDFRNAVVHNIIVEGEQGPLLVTHKGGFEKSTVEPISVETLDERNNLIGELSWQILAVPRLEYDLSQWGLGNREYPVKPPRHRRNS